MRCFLYSIEWQKLGLPHLHLLVWLTNRIPRDQINSLISAEIPDVERDPALHAIITKCMVHGPCGRFNPNDPCMKDGKCTKKFLRQLLAEMQTDQDRYPLYRDRRLDREATRSRSDRETGRWKWTTSGSFRTILSSPGSLTPTSTWNSVPLSSPSSTYSSMSTRGATRPCSPWRATKSSGRGHKLPERQVHKLKRGSLAAAHVPSAREDPDCHAS